MPMLLRIFFMKNKWPRLTSKATFLRRTIYLCYNLSLLYVFITCFQALLFHHGGSFFFILRFTSELNYFPSKNFLALAYSDQVRLQTLKTTWISLFQLWPGRKKCTFNDQTPQTIQPVEKCQTKLEISHFAT